MSISSSCSGGSNNILIYSRYSNSSLNMSSSSSNSGRKSASTSSKCISGISKGSRIGRIGKGIE